MKCPGYCRWSIAFGFAALILFCLTGINGCNRSGVSISTEKSTDSGPKIDPWQTLGKRLRKENEAGAIKAALAQLTSDLLNRPDLAMPPPISPEREKAIGELIPSLPDELAAIRGTSFTGLDSQYIADALYFRDVFRAVDPVGLAPADLTRAAFAWLCRQVYINPWVEVQQKKLPPNAMPPTFVLRRGYGSGLERAYIFLAMLEQMGIDGCLIGPPDAANHLFYQLSTDGTRILKETPQGPFWAVGARVGSEILLFDPFRGREYPGTLAELKANPERLKEWFQDTSWGVSRDDIKSGQVFLALALTGLSSRMAFLEEKTRADLGVRLTIDPAAFRDRFLAPSPNGTGLPASEVKYWNPREVFTYSRVLATYLPPELGGNDRADPSTRWSNLYNLSLIPQQVLNVPAALTAPTAVTRLKTVAIDQYFTTFYAPPSPRERIQRGQLQDALRYLADKQDTFVRDSERQRSTSQATIDEWCELANRAYKELNLAMYPNPSQTQPLSDDNPEVANARQRTEMVWKERGQTATVVLNQCVATAALAETTYLLALAKQEQAERQQMRADRVGSSDAVKVKAAAASAWAECVSSWSTFLDQSGAASVYPGRIEHARALAARAKKFASGGAK